MVDTTLHELSAIFAIIAATTAGVLAIQVWRILHRSPFGTIVALLSVAMSGTIAYHVVLFVVETEPSYLLAFRSAIYTALAAFLWLVIGAHEHFLDDVAGGR